MSTEPPFPNWRSAQGLIFTTGQIALSPDSTPTPQGMRPVAPDCTTQAHACVDRVAAILSEAGSDLTKVVRVECFLRDAADLAAWHSVFMARFAAPRPARTTLIAAPPVPGFLIELQVIAAVD